MNEEEEFVTPTIGQGDVKQAEKDRTFEGRLGAFNEQSEALKISGSQDRWKTDWNRNLQTKVFGRGPLSPESPLLDDFQNTVQTATGVDPYDPAQVGMELLDMYTAAQTGGLSYPVRKAVQSDNIPFIKQGLKEVNRKLNNWFASKRFAPDGPDGINTVRNQPLDINANPNVMQSKAVPPAIDIPDYAFPSLDNSGPKTLFQKGKARVIKSEGTNGIPVTGNVKEAFKRAGINQIEGLQTKLGIPLDKVKWQIHHKGFIRQIYDSLNGLTEEFRLKGANLLSRKIGNKLGYDPTNASAIPELLHPRIHAIINSQLSGTPNTFDLKGLERRFNLPKNWQSTYTYKQRERIINEIANVINDSTEQIDVFYRSLQGRTNLLGKLSADDYTATVLDLIALDKRLANLPTPGVMSHQGAHKYQTASEIINDILKQADKVNLSLPAFNKLDRNGLQVIAKAQIIDQKLLSEALLSNQSAKTVYNAYKDIIGVSWEEFNDILKQIDPNKLYQKGFSIKDIDQHLRTGWGDPTKGKSSLPSSYSAKDLLNKGWTIEDIENARQAGWNIILD